MLTFALAVFFLIITPGPGVLSVAGVGAAFGSRVGVRYIVGLFVGTNLVAVMVVSGMAAAILAHDQFRLILFVASLGYLVFLASKIAFAGSRIAFKEVAKAPGAWAGVVLQTVNPKAYAVNTTLFTGFAFWPENLATETTIKFVILNAIWVPIHFLWLYAGITLHRHNLAPHVHRLINMVMAISMLLVVGLALMAPR